MDFHRHSRLKQENLPTQGSKLQKTVSLDGPKQSGKPGIPPTHCRVLSRSPCPHVTGHSVYGVHGPQSVEI